MAKPTMILKLDRKRPARGEEIEVFDPWIPARFHDFLLANENKRISVLFKAGKRGRMARMTVNRLVRTCDCCSPSFIFTR